MLWRLAELARLSGASRGSFAPYTVQVLWRQMLPLDDAAEAAKHVALVQANLESHRTAIQQLDIADDPDQELALIQQDQARFHPAALPTSNLAVRNRPVEAG